MRRFRLPLGRSVLFVCLLLTALIVFLPVSLALSALGLDQRGLAARAASGSIWSGRLLEGRIGRVALGDTRIGLQPLPLLVGRARVDLSGAAGKGALSVTRNTFGVDDATGHLLTARLFAPVPLDAIDLDDVSVQFASGRCENAAGRVRATFTGDVAGLSLAQGLSGTARCDAGMLLLPLVSQSAMERLNLRIAGDGSYRAEFVVRSDDPALAAKLGAAGFTAAQGGYLLRLAGTL